MTTKTTIEGYFASVKQKKGWDSFLADDMVFTSFTSPVKQLRGYGGSGMTLLHQCEAAVKLAGHSTYNGQAQDVAEGAYCNRYVNGIVDQLTMPSSMMKTAYCLPNGGSNEQFVRIVLKYLQDHPESLNQPAVSTTSLAITGAFPCGE